MNPNLFLSVFQQAASLTPFLFPTGDGRAEMELLAISGQEASWSQRIQDGGPAHSLWQIEPGTIVAVQASSLTGDILAEVCSALSIQFDAGVIYQAIIYNDVLAVMVARLILFLDPLPLPAIGDVSDGWDCYSRNWRPGKPRPADWPANYQTAMQALGDGAGSTKAIS